MNFIQDKITVEILREQKKLKEFTRMQVKSFRYHIFMVLSADAVAKH